MKGPMNVTRRIAVIRPIRVGATRDASQSHMRSASPMSSQNHDENQNDELEHETSLDQLFGVLADDQRRHLLTYLFERDADVASFDDLTEYIVVQDADSVADLDTDDVAISLYHKHLPRLAAAGLIEYDMQSRTVRYRGTPLLETWLHRAASLNRHN